MLTQLGIIIVLSVEMVETIFHWHRHWPAYWAVGL